MNPKTSDHKDHARDQTSHLRLGAALALIHLVSAWMWRELLPLVLAETDGGVCYPLWPECWRFRFADLSTLQALVWIYGLLGLSAALLFVLRRERRAKGLLFALTLGQLGLLGLDVRLHAPVHNLSLLLNIGYLILPVPGRWVGDILILYVLCGGLYLIEAGGFGQIQAPSWALVVTMVCGLASWPLWRKEPRRWPRVLVAALVFGLASELWPGDSALTGAGRVLSLRPFERLVECDTLIQVHYGKRSEETQLNVRGVRGERACDPLVGYNEARHLCRELALDPELRTVSWHHVARRNREVEFSLVASEPNVCTASFKPQLLRSAIAAAHDHIWTRPVPEIVAAPITSPAQAEFRGGAHRNPLFPTAAVGRAQELWRSSVGNVGIHTASKSSPVVDDSGVYVGTDSGWFVAYSLDGHERWRHYVAGAARGIHATAALDADSVYIGAYNGRAYRLAKSDGRILWSHRLGEAIGASPLLLGEQVYWNVERVPVQGFAAQLERSTGRLLWASALFGDQSHSSPAASQEVLFLGDNTGHFRALRAQDGTQLWQRKMEGEIKATPAVVEPFVFVTSWDHGLYKLRMSDGTVEWRYDLGARSQSSPLVWSEQDLLVVAARDGSIHGVSPTTGLRRWLVKVEDGNNLASAILLGHGSQGRIVIACAERLLCFLNREGRVVQRLATRGRVTGEVAYHKGVIYFSENEPGDLVAVKVSD